VIFTETKLKGAYIIELEPIEDERGFFARSFCQREFKRYGLDFDVAQCNLSYNKKKGTIRGLHYQIAPYEEIKLVRCIAGAIYDAIIDIRPESPTFRQWVGIKLTANNLKMLYVPKGFAHGYLTLKDNTTVFYQVSTYYHLECERTIRWDDPEFGVGWPKMSEYIVSKKDSKC
jgi:dTDP-4-dehydrorhamnose 3,5-epimerase